MDQEAPGAFSDGGPFLIFLIQAVRVGLRQGFFMQLDSVFPELDDQHPKV